MVGHAVDFTVLFEATDEDSRARVEATLSYPRQDGGRGETASSAMIATGRVAFTFVYEAPGDLAIILSHRGEVFFQDTIPLEG